MISTVLNVNHVSAVTSFCINVNKENQPAVKEQKIVIIKDLDIKRIWLIFYIFLINQHFQDENQKSFLSEQSLMKPERA